jgi:hypothetical protein
MSISKLASQHGFETVGRASLESPAKLLNREFVKEHLQINVLEHLNFSDPMLIDGYLVLFAEDEDDYKANIEAVYDFVQLVKKSSNHVIMRIETRLKCGVLILSKFNTIDQLVEAIDKTAQHDSDFEQGLKDTYEDSYGEHVAKGLYL